ncbi:phosphotransferase enzyme family protein [Rossellomorea aquimaris]|uniref:phosphotransferase enzyme family protein n=1 Tax=Rossellomorea aquimaris TaxID=189382 RepID=UPI0007D04C2A|nr:lipopolysaccharide core heptose(II) kinase RfaY [Rossellomorea aquimaris]
MEKWVEELFSQEILEEAAIRFGCETSKVKKLGDFENYVFEVHKGNTPYILRLTHSSHRTHMEVEAELRWVNYLHEHGVNVALVNHSKEGKLVETIDVKNTHFYVCLFDKAPGQPVSVKSEEFNEELFEKWGKLTGQLHNVTKMYESGNFKRDRWDEDDLLNFEKYLSVDKDRDIIEKGEEVKKEIQSLPESLHTFGMIHSDIHPGNFFYHQGELHVFDFDDSTQFFFLSDIAIPLYYSVWWKYKNEDLETRSRFGESFLTAFLKGYMSETQLEEEWLKHMPAFLLLRDVTLYSVFHKKWDLENLSEAETSLLTQLRTRLKESEPMVDLNYRKIFNQARN